MKQNVRNTAVDVLLKIEQNQAYSNLLLNQSIQKAKLSQQDTGLLTELVYGTVQRKNTLDYLLAPFVAKGLQKLDKWVLVLLRMSLYQMVYLDRIPDHAIINEAVEIAKARGHKGISGMVNGVLRKIQREGTRDISVIENDEERLSLQYSMPQWLVHRWIEQYGLHETEKMCMANTKPSPVTGRVNVMKTNRDQVLKSLEKEGIAGSKGELSPDAVRINKGGLSHSSLFKEGYVTIQDESSMLVARALGPLPGEKILDACAAPGGKTTHIAELLNNTGAVTALDLHPHKVKLIDEQARRLHLGNIATEALDSRKAGEKFASCSFDRILVDAPCSGFGVIRKKPDIKWSKKEEDIHRIAEIQQQILAKVAKLLKPGGTLLYSTCTVDKEENHEIAEAFLDKHPDFEWDSQFSERLPEALKPFVMPAQAQVQILPQYFNSDGFYLACFKKKTTTGGETQC
ncbi:MULTISPECIES: 16S rRNA (cytosine(967)-C(5))-methyltransferase RsmB [Fictibacillus]|uniref:16S rRNA (cytosine(967)-C(5))-methyltransferase n=1 Tax=Fictibacillus enclensis TaxID=1017270 RepID=A0A0V8JD11_9BACL|nr:MULTISPECIES: 16S rRNA (cytosine(967)-C(5))-methyltransferase RsmB [Fictibacillus]KSU85023.1 16S rRNA methyltransferase [Fictibacillus enclensis]RXY99319.1 16S rRNA (cytosine(967)-C(5))-methyltransferase RsmB [Fictibacillus sp. S7]